MNIKHIRNSKVNGKTLVFSEYIYVHIYGGIVLIMLDTFSVEKDVQSLYDYSFRTLLTLFSLIVRTYSIFYGIMAMMKFSKDIRKVKAYLK